MINLRTKDWEIKNIETVLFDKDGTFIDLHYFWGKMSELRGEEIIKRFNLSQEILPQLCFFLGYDTNSGKMLSDGITALYSRQTIIEIFTKNLSEIGVQTSEKEIEKIFDEVNNIFYKEMEKYTKPIDSAIEFIKKLRTYGIKTGIVTSDSIESTNLTLKYFGWEDLFDVVVGRESTKETKESGEGVKLALEMLRAKPETCVMVGDAPMDYLAGTNGGVNKVILVSTGQIEKESLAKSSKYCVKSLEEVEII